MVAAPWAADALLVLLRWLHGMAAIAFVGWAMVLLFEPGARSSRSGAARFKEVIEVTLLVFLATGAVLSFDRLSRGAGGMYATILVLKVALSVAAFQFAFRWRRSGLAPMASDGRLLVITGSLVILLAAVLKGVFESGLRDL